MKNLKSNQINMKFNSYTECFIDSFDIALFHFEEFIMSGNLTKARIVLDTFPAIKEELSTFFPQIVHSFYVKGNVKKIGKKFKHNYNDWPLIGENLRNHSLDFLVENGLKVTDLNKNGQSLLHMLIQLRRSNDITVLHSLISNYNYPTGLLNSEKQTPLQLSIKEGDFFGAMYLIYCGSNILHLDNYGKDAYGYLDEFIASDFLKKHVNNNDSYFRGELYNALENVTNDLPLLISEDDFEAEDWMNLYPLVKN